MTPLFFASYVALWLITAVLAAAVFALYRYHGGHLLATAQGRGLQGLRVGKRAAAVGVTTRRGEKMFIGGDHQLPQVVLWTSVNCKPCVTAISAFSEFLRAHDWAIEPVVVCRGSATAVDTFAAALPENVAVVADDNGMIGHEFRIASTPLTLFIGEDGTVRAKAAPTMREGFESLVEEHFGSRPMMAPATD